MSYNLDPNNGTRNQHLTKVTRRKRSTFTLDNELGWHGGWIFAFWKVYAIDLQGFDLFEFSLAYPSSCVTLKPTEAFSYIAALQKSLKHVYARANNMFACNPHPSRRVAKT